LRDDEANDDAGDDDERPVLSRPTENVFHGQPPFPELAMTVQLVSVPPANNNQAKPAPFGLGAPRRPSYKFVKPTM
jgi:hypothetical protein